MQVGGLVCWHEGAKEQDRGGYEELGGGEGRVERFKQLLAPGLRREETDQNGAFSWNQASSPTSAYLLELGLLPGYPFCSCSTRL